MLRGVSSSGGAASGITINTSVITGGTSGRVLYDNAGTIGEATGLTFTAGAISALSIISDAVGTKELILKNFASQTANAMEVQNSSGTAYVTIGPDVLNGDGTQNFFNITRTFTTPATGTQVAANLLITGAGSSSFQQRAFKVDLLAGYSGSSAAIALTATNASIGTGVGGFTAGNANYANFLAVTGSTVGHNVGTLTPASGSSVLNLGIISRAVSATNSPALNVGGSSFALNATVNVGFIAALQSTAPTLASSAALIADNGATGAAIAIFREAGTAAFTIGASGNTTTLGTLDVNNLKFSVTTNGAQTWNNGVIAFSSTGSSNGSPDTGISRGAAGTVWVGDGTQAANGTLVAATVTAEAINLQDSGAAATVGSTAMVGGAFTVNTTAIATGDVVVSQRKTSGGTPGTSTTYTISNGTSFTLTSDNALETSTYSWVIVKTH